MKLINNKNKISIKKRKYSKRKHKKKNNNVSYIKIDNLTFNTDDIIKKLAKLDDIIKKIDKLEEINSIKEDITAENIIIKPKEKYNKQNIIPSNITPNEIVEKLSKLDSIIDRINALSLDFNMDDENVQTNKSEFEQYKELHENEGVNIQFLNEKYKNEFINEKQKKDNVWGARKVFSPNEIREALNNNRSAKAAAKFLGICYLTFRNYALKYNIPYNKGDYKSENYVESKYSLSEKNLIQVINNKKTYPIYFLKEKLIRAGLKKAKCEFCNFSTRRLSDGKLPLLISFKDGNKNNCNINNIRIVCYNCAFLHGFYMNTKGRRTFDAEKLQDSPRPVPAHY